LSAKSAAAKRLRLSSTSRKRGFGAYDVARSEVMADHRRARLAEHGRRCRADPARGTGQQDGLAGQVRHGFKLPFAAAVRTLDHPLMARRDGVVSICPMLAYAGGPGADIVAPGRFCLERSARVLQAGRPSTGRRKSGAGQFGAASMLCDSGDMDAAYEQVPLSQRAPCRYQGRLM
jgi:hypothetical protein